EPRGQSVQPRFISAGVAGANETFDGGARRIFVFDEHRTHENSREVARPDGAGALLHERNGRSAKDVGDFRTVGAGEPYLYQHAIFVVPELAIELAGNGIVRGGDRLAVHLDSFSAKLADGYGHAGAVQRIEKGGLLHQVVV